MVRENLREAPDFVKGVVERSGRRANHIRFTEIALHTGNFQFGEQLQRMFADEER